MAFLFSITKKEKLTQINQSEVIWCKSHVGPIFGWHLEKKLKIELPLGNTYSGIYYGTQNEITGDYFYLLNPRHNWSGKFFEDEVNVYGVFNK
jgi:hypothetical protein